MGSPAFSALFSEMLKDLTLVRPLIVFDLEATGPDPRHDRIVEIGALKVPPREQGSPETYERRIDPGMRIPAEATAVHGITNADLAGCPAFAAIADEVAAFFAGADLAGYNVRGFDLKLLANEFRRARKTFPLEGRRILDAQTIFFRREPRDLKAAYRFFCGREHDRAHSALGDVLATVEVLAGELTRYPDLPRDVEQLGEYCRPADGRWVDAERRFEWRDGVAVFGFGRHRGRRLQDVAEKSPEYLAWILDGDFSEETKDIVKRAAEGVFPVRAE